MTLLQRSGKQAVLTSALIRLVTAGYRRLMQAPCMERRRRVDAALAHRALGWHVGVLMLGWCSLARAGNDDGILLGNDAALTAGAVVATVNDGSALWYNPAGLALAAQDSVDVGASAFALRRYNMRGLISADGGSRSDASFTEIVTIPSALTYVRRINDRTVAGLALFASQVSDYTLRTALTLPIEQVADLRLQVLITQETARYHLAGGFAMRLPRGFRAGVSLLGDYQDEVGLLQAATSAGLRADGTPLGLQVSSAFTQSKALGFHLRAGLMYQPVSVFQVALSVESPGMYFYRSGRVTAVEGATVLNEEGAFSLSEVLNADESASEVTFGKYAPWRVRLGAALGVGRGTLSLEGDVQTAVRDEDVGVDRAVSWNLRAGARFVVSEHIRLGGGLFTDRGPERTDQWGAGAIDFYGATLGGQYENVRWLASAGKHGEPRAGLTFSSTIALRYAYGTGKLPGQRLVLPDYEARTVGVDLDVHEVTLHLGSGVYF